MTIVNILALSGLFNGIGALMLGLITLRYGKTTLHRLFALLNLAIIIWALSYWRWLLADNYETALFWTRMLSIGSTLIPIFFLHWILSLLNIAKKHKILLLSGYLMTALFLVFSFSPYFVKTVEPTFAFPYWPKPGIFYHFYIIFSYISLMGYGIYRLVIKYKNTIGLKKAQIKYVFLGTLIAAPAGFSNFFLWYNINIPPYLNFVVLAYVGCYAYAIIRYQLMDIRIIVRKSTIYLIIAGFVYACFYGVTWLLSRWFGNIYNQDAMIFGIFLAFAFVFAFIWFEKLVRYLANRYFFNFNMVTLPTLDTQPQPIL